MGYTARTIEVMVASPSDVGKERKIFREVIENWNATHAREREVVLLATGWETHASPDLHGRAQDLINERVLDHCDLLVGIFWHRAGTPTGKSISGSIEEVERHHMAGKPVMLYFSEASVPQEFDPDQWVKVQQFKNWAAARGLVWGYSSAVEFRELFSRQLHITLRDNPYLHKLLTANTAVAPSRNGKTAPAPEFPSSREIRSSSTPTEAQKPLSDVAVSILHKMNDNPNGRVYFNTWGGDFTLSFNGSDNIRADTRRRAVELMDAIEELQRHDLIEGEGGSKEAFVLTSFGFRVLDGMDI